MPYGTSIAIGSLCGFVGLATFAVTDSSQLPAAGQPSMPTQIDSRVDSRGLNAPIPAINADHMPPRRVPVELTRNAAFGPAIDNVAAMNGAATDIDLPIGRAVCLTLEPIYVGSGSNTRKAAVWGELHAIDGRWVQLSIGGIETFIERSKVVAISVEPPPAGLAVATPTE